MGLEECSNEDCYVEEFNCDGHSKKKGEVEVWKSEMGNQLTEVQLVPLLFGMRRKSKECVCVCVCEVLGQGRTAGWSGVLPVEVKGLVQPADHVWLLTKQCHWFPIFGQASGDGDLK